MQNTCLGPRLHTKFLISSRKGPAISAQLGSKPKICLDENKKVELDIRRYVDHKIQLIQSDFVGELEPKVFTEIANSVVDKADGEPPRYDQVYMESLTIFRDVPMGEIGHPRA